MAAFGSKTPVSHLQEYLVSKKIIPEYKLIHKVMGTHNPEFTFRVQAGDFWEEGKGRSKQEAKHRAAEKMLRSLKVIDSNEVEEEVNEFEQEIYDNYIGQLKDLCYSQHYPEPKYYLEEAGGPAHSRVFKMTCCVSQLQEFGIHRTKKQAKQQAAFKMIQCLKEVGGKKIEEALANPETPSCYLNKSTAEITDTEIYDKYSSLKGGSFPADHKDNAAFYKDHYKAYVGLQKNSPTLANLLSKSTTVTLDNSVEIIEEVAKELGSSVSTALINSKQAEVMYTVMTMSIIPAIGDIGCSKEEAAFNLLKSLICLCRE